MYAEEPLERGDRVVISKNDYYWGKQNDMEGFIANGETAEVTWVGKTEKAYGRYFTDVELRFVSDGRIMGAKAMLRSLVCEGPSIPRAEMERFYTRVMESYEGELSKKIKGAMEDPYYNALQMKYAYCVTCHKAQGGQWKHVYIDMGGIAPEAMTADFYRWLYTALTRATQKVFFINPTMQLM
ncbi:MAG: ATP-binding domain-containing protein [Muribaculaceae bacterium]|nr:ATP-binding domain-containing protein [Muribaculaceae bacterium]